MVVTVEVVRAMAARRRVIPQTPKRTRVTAADRGEVTKVGATKAVGIKEEEIKVDRARAKDWVETDAQVTQSEG